MLRIYYIHGFLSGPNAAKARLLQDYISKNCDPAEVCFYAPDFPETPKEAFETLIDFFAAERRAYPADRIVLIGSSMGGFFSSLISQRFSFPAVLLNPCVHPQLYFKNLIGDQYNELTDRHFVLKDDMLPFLKALDDSIVVSKYKLMVYIGTADEVLDSSFAEKMFADCEIRKVEGADHAFSKGFERLIPSIMDFAFKAE